jgi:hypothetical protein
MEGPQRVKLDKGQEEEEEELRAQEEQLGVGVRQQEVLNREAMVAVAVLAVEVGLDIMVEEEAQMVMRGVEDPPMCLFLRL